MKSCRRASGTITVAMSVIASLSNSMADCLPLFVIIE
jgi:hypothetical protein